MSVMDLTTEPGVTTTPAAVRPRGVSRATWLRVGLVCTLLVASGAVRIWQARRFQALSAAWQESPFPLEQFPLALGPWKGEPVRLDEQIARATGATDHVVRRYVHQTTGVNVDVILLYGPATAVFIHKPEVCYPSAGFEPAALPVDRVIEAGTLRAPFRALLYAKGDGAPIDRQEVYYSWRFGGRWSPETGTFKQLERIPGMYKLHLARSVTGQEKRDVGNPCEALLQELLPALEERIGQTAKPSPSS
jgi:hypothetical protein